MDDNQREAMYNGWAKDKIFLDTTSEKDENGVCVKTEYEGNTYSARCNFVDVYGSASPEIVAYNRLVIMLRDINKNIELNLPK